MKKQIHQDVFIGFVCLAITLLIFALNMGLPSDAAMMPRLLAALLTILSILIIYHGMRKSQDPAEAEKKELTWDVLKIPVITWCIVALYVALFAFIGYIPATAIIRFMKQTSWPIIITIDVVYLLLMYFVFARMLNVSIDGFGILGRLL